MATAHEIADDLKYDVDRIPLPGEEKASDGAIAVLQELDDEHAAVERSLAYARQTGNCRRIKTGDLLRTLQHADGRLALVTWGSGGITAIGYLPLQQRFDTGGYSAVRDLMGDDDAEYYETCRRAAVKDILAHAKPDVVCRHESNLLEDIDRGEGR